jgi:hypothetical protein
MPTKWYYPNNISQYAEVQEHVPWVEDFHKIKHPDGNFLRLSKTLLHIANSRTNDLKMKTYYLILEDFQIDNCPQIISGIEVEINMNRGGRITDDTVQLRYNSNFVGVNKADFDLAPKKIYGNQSDLWDTSLTKLQVENNTFGIGVRFQSHPSWPHNEYAKVDYIRLRLY